MRSLFILLPVFFISALRAQVTVLKEFQTDYPVLRIMHYPKCGDNPILVCKKTDEVNTMVHGTMQFDISSNENVVFANAATIYTLAYLNEDMTLTKYQKKSNKYSAVKTLKLPKTSGNRKYYIDIEANEDQLFYFAYQPHTSSKAEPSVISFYNPDLEKVFSVSEDLSIYNFHCFGTDSILLLKEYPAERNLTTHLYNSNGKLLKDETFHLYFKPNLTTAVGDFLRNEGIIFTVEQSDTLKTHVLKYAHNGTMLWDKMWKEHYYGFTEFKDHLLAYGGGTFNNPSYKLLYIDENSGAVDEEVDLQKYYLDFLNSKQLQAKDHSFIPFGFNVNPEHTWISLVMSIYPVNGKSLNADRILILQPKQEVKTLDIEIPDNEHPKVVPTDNNHLVVAIGKKVTIYKVE